jgi:palmitoyltransferase ZDHHC9/14/18
MQVFFLDGRVICGPDPRGLILTTIAVLLSEWIFLVDVVDPSSKHPILIAAFSLVLAATVSDATPIHACSAIPIWTDHF